MRKPIDQATRAYIYSRDEGVCQHCGCKVAHDNFHVDHVVPIVRGGTNDIDNYVLSCPSCNIRKRHHELPEVKRHKIVLTIKERNATRLQMPMEILVSRKKRVFNADKLQRKTSSEKVYVIDEIYFRIKQAFNLKNERKAVAEFLGIQPTTLDNWRVRNAIADWDVIFNHCKGVNLNWLITGEGDMFYAPDQNAQKLADIQEILNR